MIYAGVHNARRSGYSAYGNSSGQRLPAGDVKGRAAPDFTLATLEGQEVKLSDLRGKAVLLNFWATWCGPCKIEIPMLKGLQETYQDRNFTVLGVSLEEEGWTVVRPYMERAQFNYPVAVGGEDIAALYGGLNSVPTTL